MFSRISTIVLLLVVALFVLGGCGRGMYPGAGPGWWHGPGHGSAWSQNAPAPGPSWCGRGW